jgi:glucose-6-phosphate 1-dehydrogenase
MITKKPDTTVLVIMGASGDLTYRKLIPALYNLFLDGWMPDNFEILGVALNTYEGDGFINRLKEGIDKFSRPNTDNADAQWQVFKEKIKYFSADFTKAGIYSTLETYIDDKAKVWGGVINTIFYLAISPTFIGPVTEHLANMQICKNKTCSRIVVEKPFGHDLESALALNKMLTTLFAEEQIYRIDHYLGKEAVQNILAFRFANVLFEPLWNRNYIDHIQITVAENIGIENRGGYYDNAGALRDMIQNHILQLLCIIAMEAPTSFEANEIRNKKVDVLNAIRRITTEDVKNVTVRGQYGKSETVKSYREEQSVKPDSTTETFAAIKFHVDNWRWQGLPFYVRTGKNLNEKLTSIVIQFKNVPHNTFPLEASKNWQPNKLIIDIQPNMDIRLSFQAKQPGQGMKLIPVDMVYNFVEPENEDMPEAYETLLLDVMEGEATQFMRADQVEAAWKIVMPIIEQWQNNKAENLFFYTPQTMGPKEADTLIESDGRQWIN